MPNAALSPVGDDRRSPQAVVGASAWSERLTANGTLKLHAIH